MSIYTYSILVYIISIHDIFAGHFTTFEQLPLCHTNHQRPHQPWQSTALEKQRQCVAAIAWPVGQDGSPKRRVKKLVALSIGRRNVWYLCVFNWETLLLFVVKSMVETWMWFMYDWLNLIMGRKLMLPWRSMVLGDVMAGIRRLRKEQMGQKEGESLATGRIEISRLKLRTVLRIRES